MLLENLAVGVLLVALAAYAVFGGADFGSGTLTALASGPRKDRQRSALFFAIGPVWETNHIWLILVVVALFTAFPPAFAQLFTALLIPLLIALAGIVFRGAAFGFRHFGLTGNAHLPATGLVFSAASVITPFAMGICLGAMAGGEITVVDGTVTSGPWEPWLKLFPILCGLIGISACTLLAAAFITPRTSGELQQDFRRRGIAAALVMAALLAVSLPVAHSDAASFWDELNRPDALIVVSFAGAAWVATVLALWRGPAWLAPFTAAVSVALTVAGWAVALYPDYILPSGVISDVAAPEATLRALLIALLAGSAVLVPSLVLLYRTFGLEPAESEPGQGGEPTAQDNS